MNTSSAGPEAPALIRKRGARIGVFQKGRLPRPASRNAVTVWIEMAHAIDRKTNGRYASVFGFSPEVGLVQEIAGDVQVQDAR